MSGSPTGHLRDSPGRPPQTPKFALQTNMENKVFSFGNRLPGGAVHSAA